MIDNLESIVLQIGTIGGRKLKIGGEHDLFQIFDAFSCFRFVMDVAAEITKALRIGREMMVTVIAEVTDALAEGVLQRNGDDGIGVKTDAGGLMRE